MEFKIKERDSLLLPITSVNVRGFSHQAALLSILMAYDECKAWVCNNFIQIFSLKNLCDSWRSGTLDFYYMDYNDFRSYEYTANPWIKWYSIPIDIIKDENDYNIIDFITTKLNDEFYIYLRVDTYFISAYSDYKNNHRIHCLYICGYNKKDSTIMCLDNFAGGVFGLMEIPMKEIVAAYNGSYSEYIRRPKLNRQDKICPSVCIFQIVLTAEEIMNPDINEVNLSRIICSLENYLEMGRDNLAYMKSTYYVYGIEAYNELTKFTYRNYEKCEEMDIRAFCSMKDHKSLMIWRLQYIEDKYNICLQDIIKSYVCLEAKLNTIIMQILKFNLSRDAMILEKIRRNIEECLDKEKVVVENLILILKQLA